LASVQKLEESRSNLEAVDLAAVGQVAVVVVEAVHVAVVGEEAAAVVSGDLGEEAGGSARPQPTGATA
jgi:hypothetical protein